MAVKGLSLIIIGFTVLALKSAISHLSIFNIRLHYTVGKYHLIILKLKVFTTINFISVVSNLNKNVNGS